jgi:hypothetical protein
MLLVQAGRDADDAFILAGLIRMLILGGRVNFIKALIFWPLLI